MLGVNHGVFLLTVIDFCLTKELICDTETSYSSLQLVWASKQNCTQRKGKDLSAHMILSSNISQLIQSNFKMSLRGNNNGVDFKYIQHMKTTLNQ